MGLEKSTYRKLGEKYLVSSQEITCPVSVFYNAFVEPERLGGCLFEIASELAATRPELFGFSRAPQVWEYNVAASSMFDGGHLR